MAINIKFDLIGNPEPPTIVLANRNGNKLGQLNVNVESIDLSNKLNDASEISFTVNKYIDGKLTPLWDKVVDFKLIYCKEWDTWFEIKVELDEATESVKTVFCTQLGQAELSQIKLYDIEINTEDDIARDDYKISILYDKNDPKASILDRLLDKAPHYRIAHVDSTIANIQRSFSFDDTSLYDALQEVAEEIGCLFTYPSNSETNGSIRRDIHVYDLQQNCNDCGYRGEYTGECPKCGSTNIKYGYGEDTLIFVTADELATKGIQFVTDTDSVKNCFKLEAGDDLMTATVRNCNPNGSDYIYYFSDDVKEDMSEELVNKIETYDNIYKQYYNDYLSDIDSDLLNDYNSLVSKYSVYNKDLQEIITPIKGYSSLMNAYYNTIDLALYLKSGLMPSIEMSETNAKEQVKLLTSDALSPVAVTDVNIASLVTVNSTVLAMAKIIVKSTYKVEIKNSELYDEDDKRYWRGNFVVTNYSDEDDVAESNVAIVEVNDDQEYFIKQKIDKALNKENTDDLSVTGLFEKEYDDFCDELKKYALNPLLGFRDACQSCIDILMEQGVGDNVENDLYKNLYAPYYNKLKALESEIKIREDEINVVAGIYDIDGDLITKGLQTIIEECKSQVQKMLNFRNYLGEELWLEFCLYRREDKYSNENYISDGLNNAELFDRALEFFRVAENEIYKSSELQHSISTTLNNLLAIPKFKNLVSSFDVGNWIRVQVDGKIYKLRLLEYDISFKDFSTIQVEFSDVAKIKNGITDVESILTQASSMASSYGAIQRQANQGNIAQNTIEQWLMDGLDASLVQIQSNNNEDITITRNGLLGRSYSDITGTYSPKQIKLTHNILAYTDNNWESVRLAIGEHEYVSYDKDIGEFTKKIGYGIGADFVSAGIVSGSQIIGGDIYSDNYYNSKDEKTGSYLNLKDGTFSFAGGKLTYDGDHLSVDGEITIATSGTIGCWNVNNLSIYKGSEVFADPAGMYFGTDGLSLGSSFQVKSNGSAIASDLTLTGGSLTIGDKFSVDINGYLKTIEGNIGGWEIGENYLQKNGIVGMISLDADEESDNEYVMQSVVTPTIIVENEEGEEQEMPVYSSIRFYAGAPNKNQYNQSKFAVLEDGSLYASSAQISGTINALAGGTIGGFTIGDNSIYYSGGSIGESVYLGTDRIVLGDEDTFYVTNTGYLYAAYGDIGGCSIVDGYLEIDGSHITNLSADTITSGTLDASAITVTGLSANSITTGTLTVGGVAITGFSNNTTTLSELRTISEDCIKVTEVEADKLKVKAANVTGLLEAVKIATDDITSLSTPYGAINLEGGVSLYSQENGQQYGGMIALSRDISSFSSPQLDISGTEVSISGAQITISLDDYADTNSFLNICGTNWNEFVKDVGDYKFAIESIEEAIGDEDSGLISDVGFLFNELAGLQQMSSDVFTLQSDVSRLQTKVSELEQKINKLEKV